MKTTTSRAQRLTLWGGRIVALAALVWVSVVFVREVRVASFQWNLLALWGALGCLVLQLMVYCNTTAAWRLCTGMQLSWREALFAVGVSQVAKYLPGNVFQFASRVAVSERYGLHRASAIVAMAVESWICLVVTLLAALLFLWLTPAATREMLWREMPVPQLPSWVVLAGLAAVGAVLVMKWQWLRKGVASLQGAVTPWRLGLASLCIGCSALLYGAMSLMAQHAFFPQSDLMPYSLHVAGYATAWVLGYITPGAPGGVGVREGVFLLLYSPYAGTAVAASMAVVLRIISTLGDGCFFAATWVVRPRLEASNAS